MKINFLKAGSGDCILIRHNGKNVLIDGGNDSSYLIDQIKHIYNASEKIDILIITHHDDDHIKGILELLTLLNIGEFGEAKTFIDKIFFNSPNISKLPIENNDENLISFNQAKEVEKLLTKMNLTWEQCLENKEVNLDGLKLEFLSPTAEAVKEYYDFAGELLTSEYKSDWSSTLDNLLKYVDDKSQDRSKLNASSIVILLTCEKKKVLLTADVTPKRLEQIINKLAEKESDGLVYFDLVKLPHHGSYRSLNKKIISKICCLNFVITTNGKKHYHPNKKTIAKIIEYSNRKETDEINFFFNYDLRKELNFSNIDLSKYKIKLLKHNSTFGYVI